MIHTTYADVFLPQRKANALFYNLSLIISGSILITLSAKISIHLGFSPIPITMQTFAVLFIGALFGSKRGALTVLAYLFQGFMGIPVFANAGSGFVYLLGPTGGYLVGFVFAAYITGLLAERGWDRIFWKTAIAMAIGTIIIFIFGVSWLSFSIGWSKAIMVGLFPFVIGAILKIMLADAILPLGWRILEKINRG